jgi:subtilisin family serine protease
MTETSPNPFSFTPPPEHYFLWHLAALGVISVDYDPAGPVDLDLAAPEITGTLWDSLHAQFPSATTPARVALIDVGVTRNHPNLAGRIDLARSIDLVTHPYGAKSVLNPAATPFDGEQREAFFTGLDLAGLAPAGLDPAETKWLADLVAELAASEGVVRTLIDTDDVFGSHGTGIAGLVVGEPAVMKGSDPASFADILAGVDEVRPADDVGLLPYFGVDPLSQLVSIRTSFEQNAAHFISAFLYAWKSGADVILLPRGIPDPVRAALQHKPELDLGLDDRRNWERADLFARLAEATDPATELRPGAVGAAANSQLGWNVLAKLIVAISKSMPIVCAAGNDGESQLIYPASLAASDNGIVAVGAMSAAGRRSGYSNYGEGLTLVAPSDDGEVYNRHQLRLDRTDPLIDQHAWVLGTAVAVPYSSFALMTTDLPGAFGYADGTEPYSSVFAPHPNPGYGGGYYTTFGGTSGASALVGGVAALLARANKARHGANARLDGPAMKALLVNASDLGATIIPGSGAITADPMNASDEPNKGKPYFFGAGLLNAAAALTAVLA